MNTTDTEIDENILNAAHEIWALAQLFPHEGIEDGTLRIAKFLKEEYPTIVPSPEKEELWVIFKEHTLQVNGHRPELALILQEKLPKFTSFEAASKYLSAFSFPLGYVAKKL